MISAGTSMDPAEFRVLRDYLEKHCAIHVTEEKRYLFETRLTALMVENGCKNFTELHAKAVADKTMALRDKIVDAMTTNETLWFRDTAPFSVLDQVLLPALCKEMRAGTRQKIKIWCAASSTGQEPYSIAMTILELSKKTTAVRPEYFEILATDISPTVLFLAMAGRYDSLAVSRGLPVDIRDRYFEPAGKVWALKEHVRKMVTFKKLNLQDSFSHFGRQDIIFCRNVLIYFADEFKRSLLNRMGELLKPGGYLFVGASESIINYTTQYEMLRHVQALYYRIK